ncbi:MAG: tRNA (N(6)-L-threonylcarbamoyladenosine(37)-C(2))-methylthiotransferase MtaB [Pseudomonadota bacterium]|nr:tRNA (N(6)-L-threonylcarbamoyladenosine(37)-C(2))-methylthiotransferase MtaB [Pseudomonadota bacterium]
MSPPVQAEIITLGCRLNIAESETIRQLAGARDMVVVNSCAVTNEAVRETRRAIRRARRDRPDAEIVVTGCASQIDPAGFAAMPEVNRIVGNLDKLRADHWGAAHPVPAAFDGHSRAFVEVQNGCDHRCTFCAIPFGRGPSRSVPAGGVIDRIAALVDAGHREVVLTGVDLTSYGPDLPGAPTLGLLVERILAHAPALERLRLSSLDGIEIDDRLFDLITTERRVMPHVHLSLQAGDDMILKRMKRRHSRADSVRLVERLKAAGPEIAIGADLIAGFPTESEAMFADTRALIDDCDIVHAHIFRYSPRADTPAARMPQIEPEVRKARAALLREAAAGRKAAWLHSLVGSTQQVLVERPGDRGHSGNFAEVAVDTQPVGDVIAVKVERTDGIKLFGSSAKAGVQLQDAAEAAHRSVSTSFPTGPLPSPGIKKSA